MLRSLQAQDTTDWEAVVVDDGAGEAIDRIARINDPRITALPNEGRGQPAARITAIAAATGAIVAWLDDDDWWDDPCHLTLLRAAALARPSSFFFRGGWIVDDSGARETYDLAATAESLRKNNTILTSSIAYPRRLHDELGPLDTTLGGYCDWDFMLRMCDAGLVPYRLPGLGVAYAVHDTNASTDYDAPERRADFERFRDKHRLDVEIANHVLIHRMLGMAVPEGWEEVDGALQRQFELETFPAAIAFVDRVAELAEAESHHPDIQINYRRVTLRWRTHSADAITDMDREMAERSAALA
jgi:4a-hydroxytetrahydrobiopterin dehydratase